MRAKAAAVAASAIRIKSEVRAFTGTIINRRERMKKQQQTVLGCTLTKFMSDGYDVDERGDVAIRAA